MLPPPALFTLGNLPRDRGEGESGNAAFHRLCSVLLAPVKAGPCFSVSLLHSRCASAPEWLPCTVNRHLRARQSVECSNCGLARQPHWHKQKSVLLTGDSGGGTGERGATGGEDERGGGGGETRRLVVQSM